MNLKLPLVVCLGALIFGCSNKQVYQDIQHNRLAACDREPNESARAECMQGLDRSYEAYKHEREELIKGE